MNQPQHTCSPAPPTPGWVLVVLRGALDLASAPEVRARLGAAMGGRRTTIVVDLSAVDFMDSFGLRELVAARARLVAGRRTVVVRAPSPAVLRLLGWTAGHASLGLSVEPVAVAGGLPVSA